MEELKTTDAQRKATREYEKRNDRINVVFPSGTRERMDRLGIKSKGAFIKEAVEKELKSLEKYMK
jgi:predicted DNA-binding protein